MAAKRYLRCYGSLCLYPPDPARTSSGGTRTGDIRSHQVSSRALDREMDILVYLPPGYSDYDSWNYPVLYLHDGQNVFDEDTAVFGVEWGIDEAAEQLIIERKIPGIIMVAVLNTPERIANYTPFPDSEHGGGRGPAYRKFLIEELKPFVDSNYHTNRHGGQTAVAGSSLGGLSALYLSLTRPDVFGRAAALSPSLWWGGRGLITRIAGDIGQPVPERLWVDMGTDESSEDLNQNGVPDVIDDARALKAVLLARGFRLQESLFYEEIEGGTHDEAAWAARIEKVLMTLFPHEGPPTPR